MLNSQAATSKINNNPDDYMTAAEVAAYIRKKPAWVKSHSNGNAQPTIPSIKMGKERVYRREAVDVSMIDFGA